MNKNLSQLQHKVYLSYHQDGILDLVVATTILEFSAFMATGIVVFLIVGILFATQYILMKQRITIPRFGYVRFVPEKKALMQNWGLVGIGVLVLFLVFAANMFLKSNPTSQEMQAWMQRYHMVPLSAMLFALPALVAAIFLGLKRFFLYALLAVALPVLGAILEIETFIPIMATGFLVLAFGIWLLANFLKKYPVSDKAGSDVSE
ncbi:MAG: hypothetical protein ABIF04_06815 [Chloroflexota bacterium]